MKKLAELQLSTVTKQAIRSTITNQVLYNIEFMSVVLYKLQVYDHVTHDFVINCLNDEFLKQQHFANG